MGNLKVLILRSYYTRLLCALGNPKALRVSYDKDISTRSEGLALRFLCLGGWYVIDQLLSIPLSSCLKMLKHMQQRSTKEVMCPFFS
ncbi:hypothetical protein M8C21_031379 [Ambrosia artemisiifolia]|uniref:Uncharacterized protein n=1 Tax=Ambrosia artemisiifolia TaxID=4212 RepID=A0AAD5CTP8_AMBAR|nr:hypothetical protein M8C21_031379 [Ambrosia artemisiifolia]